jgi:NADH dehydrogenase/NADH:ubiquinone oxidoreductase subunit G
MQIKINAKKYSVQAGETILDVCRREKIDIPTLCSLDGYKKEAACRLCLVEVAGKLVTSCTTKVQEGLEVITENAKIKKAREINLELLWSDHAGKCAQCKKNRQCEFQDLAEKYKIENFHFVPRKGEMTKKEELNLVKDNWSRVVTENENPVIDRTTEYCVECRRCINVCPLKEYGFNYRAGDVVVGTPFEKILDCIFCGACVAHCPTAALTDQGDLKELVKKLNDPQILAVAIIDPAIMATIKNEVKEIDKLEKLNKLLRLIGFERVFDLTWGFEKYVQETIKELYPTKYVLRKSPKKQRRHFEQIKIASFCPSAEIYIQKYYPELTRNILKVKRPEDLMAQAVKVEYAQQEKINASKIFTVLISSCTARKKTLTSWLDQVITVRELGRIVKKDKMDTSQLSSSTADNFLTKINSEYQELYKSGQLAKIIKQKTQGNFKVKSVNGVAEIKKELDKIQRRESEVDFLTALICSEGCDNGGGQSFKLK